jgi:hypothetical protein
MPSVVVVSSVVWVLSVTPAFAQAPSHGTEGALQASTYVAAATAPVSTYAATGLPEASCDYWRYY